MCVTFIPSKSGGNITCGLVNRSPTGDLITIKIREPTLFEHLGCSKGRPRCCNEARQLRPNFLQCYSLCLVDAFDKWLSRRRQNT